MYFTDYNLRNVHKNSAEVQERKQDEAEQKQPLVPWDLQHDKGTSPLGLKDTFRIAQMFALTKKSQVI
jgi:hypothetical protein